MHHNGENINVLNVLQIIFAGSQPLLHFGIKLQNLKPKLLCPRWPWCDTWLLLYWIMDRNRKHQRLTYTFLGYTILKSLFSTCGSWKYYSYQVSQSLSDTQGIFFFCFWSHSGLKWLKVLCLSSTHYRRESLPGDRKRQFLPGCPLIKI